MTATRPSGFNTRKMLTLISAGYVMVVNLTHEDRIATFRWKTSVRFAGFDDRDIRELSLGDIGLNVGQPIGVQFRREYVARRTNVLGSGNSHVFHAYSDFSDRLLGFPDEARGKLLCRQYHAESESDRISTVLPMM
jgi:hypothetical protein